MSLKIKQKFHHYLKWEDFKNGLYDSNCDYYEDKVKHSEELLSNQDLFFETGCEMVTEWVYSSEQNLTDSSMNRRAWIGQATCCFNHKAPDYATKEAWWNLDDETRKSANKTADRILAYWQQRYILKGSLWQSMD